MWEDQRTQLASPFYSCHKPWFIRSGLSGKNCFAETAANGLYRRFQRHLFVLVHNRSLQGSCNMSPELTGDFSCSLFCCSFPQAQMNPTGHIGVKGRPEGFHQIISQRRCMFPGLMKNAEAGIQPQRKEILQYARQQNLPFYHLPSTSVSISAFTR